MRSASARRASPEYATFDSDLRATLAVALEALSRSLADRRAPAEPVRGALEQIRLLEQLIGWAEHDLVQRSADALIAGATLTQIGEALGMSRQGAAHKLRHIMT